MQNLCLVEILLFSKIFDELVIWAESLFTPLKLSRTDPELDFNEEIMSQNPVNAGIMFQPFCNSFIKQNNQLTFLFWKVYINHTRGYHSRRRQPQICQAQALAPVAHHHDDAPHHCTGFL